MHPVFRGRLTIAKPGANVWHLNDEVLSGDVGVGDIIALPGTDEGLLVTTSADSAHEVTLTAQTRLRRLGRVHVL
jgi:hypothetical protein